MTTSAEHLEDELVQDLRKIGDRLGEADLWDELYRALADRRWFRASDGPARHVALSFTRAEELVNGLRAERGRAPLELAQTGGEGVLDPGIARELEALGWASEPLDTSRHDDAHLDSPQDEPRTPPSGRFDEAHAAAAAERRRKAG